MVIGPFNNEKCGFIKSLPSCRQLKLSDHEIFMRALKVFSESNCPHEVAIHPKSCREFYLWSVPFLASYLAFWDSPEPCEFLLGDSSMYSEYEGSHEMTGGLSLSKVSYCSHMVAEGGDAAPIYAYHLALSSTMPENYDFFVVNPHRLLVSINPFFKLSTGTAISLGTGR